MLLYGGLVVGFVSDRRTYKMEATMLDMFDDGLMANDGIMDDVVQEDLVMNDLADDAILGTDGFDLNNDSVISDDATFLNGSTESAMQNDVEIGDIDASGHVLQTTDFTCAVVSQQMVLKEFGIDLSETQLSVEARENGWLELPDGISPGGTMPIDMNNLLESHGVDSHHGSGIEDMVSELAQGHKVIVGVDSGELSRTDGIFEDLFHGEQADHAIVVKGIKLDEQGEPIVVVNDPGDPLGAGKEYPMDDFMDAFQDGGCHYVATDHAPLGFEPIESDLLSSYATPSSPTTNQDSLAGLTSNANSVDLEHAPENMTEADKDDILFGLDSHDLKNIAKGVANTVRRL